jgi:hypothetical protein
VELDLDRLEDLIRVLRTTGIKSFSCKDFSLELGDEPIQEKTVRETISDGNKKVTPDSAWKHPSLWPAGVPARFPGASQ